MRSGRGPAGGRPWLGVVGHDRRSSLEPPVADRPVGERVVDRGVGIGRPGPAPLAPGEQPTDEARDAQDVVRLGGDIDHVEDDLRIAPGLAIAPPGRECGCDGQRPARMIEVRWREFRGQGVPPATDRMGPEDPFGRSRAKRPQESRRQRAAPDGPGGTWPRSIDGRQATEDTARRIAPQHDVALAFLERKTGLVSRRDLDRVPLVDQGAPQADGPRVRARGVADQHDSTRPAGGPGALGGRAVDHQRFPVSSV